MTLTPAQRLIVAADFTPDPKKGENQNWVRRQVLGLAEDLKETGVYLKVESALRICGYELIRDIHNLGLKVMADLKLVGIPRTLSADGMMLDEFKPELVTVFCSTGVRSLQALKIALPASEVLGVTALTSFTSEDTSLIHRGEIPEVVSRLAHLAYYAEIDGVVCSPQEAAMVRHQRGPGFMIVCTNIRSVGDIVADDDQNLLRSMNAAEAIRAGSDRIVVGGPIVGNSSPYDATLRIIDEIATATETLPAA